MLICQEIIYPFRKHAQQCSDAWMPKCPDVLDARRIKAKAKAEVDVNVNAYVYVYVYACIRVVCCVVEFVLLFIVSLLLFLFGKVIFREVKHFTWIESRNIWWQICTNPLTQHIYTHWHTCLLLYIYTLELLICLLAFRDISHNNRMK